MLTKNFLIFYLYGPMSAWGDIAVGVERPSFDRPGKSAILGLIAASLGIERQDVIAMQQLQTKLGFAVRVDHSGIMLSDYHTVQIPTAVGLKKLPHYTRRDEKFASDKKTVVSNRNYLSDAMATVILWQKCDQSGNLLNEIHQALERPKFQLFLGRKSFPLALPVSAALIEATFLEQALEKADQIFLEKLIRLPSKSFLKFKKLFESEKNSKSLYCDIDAPVKSEIKFLYTRRDNCRNRLRWQFENRYEHQITL